MDRNGLLAKIAELPAGPGVYLFKDARGRVIYVGKAAHLRSRVRSYFAEHPTDRANVEVMMPHVVDLDTLTCESEVDALLTEARLIKDIGPRYNIQDKDSKSFPYLEIRVREDFPRVALTREPAPSGTRLFGPFTDVDGARRALQVMQRVFRFRTCSLDIRPDDAKRRFQRPCLLYYIKQCTGPCADLVSRDVYRLDVRNFIRFLAGKRAPVIRDLTARMQAASNARQFERAADLRDQVRALESLDQRGSLLAHPQPEVFYTDPTRGLERLKEVLGLDRVPRAIEGVDIATTAGEASVGALVTFLDGKPFKNGYRRYRIKSVPGIDDYAMVREVVARRFSRLEREGAVFPDILLIDGGPGQLSAALEALAALQIQPPLVLAIAKREELIYRMGGSEPLRLGRTSPALKVLQYIRDEAHRFASHYHHLLRGKRILDENAPHRRRKRSTSNIQHSTSNDE
jgi:excinuclease ABC subunit C